MSSEEFLNLLGVNTHLDGNSGWNTNATQVGSQINYIGVRLQRDWPTGSTADGVAFNTVHQQNPLSRLWLSIGNGSPAQQRTFLGYCQQIYHSYGSALVYAMGGPNEPDLGYSQNLGARLPDSALVQQALFDWADPRGIKVSQIEFGAGWTAQNNWQGDYNPTNPGINYTMPQNGDQRYTPGEAHFGGSHPYLIDTTTKPGARLAAIRSLALLPTPGKPVANTEWGAYTSSGLSPTVFGQYMVMGAFDSAAAGDAAYIIYGLQDAAIEGTYGFFKANGTANPVANYFHHLTTVLQCADANLRYAPGQPITFTPGSLNLTYSNTSAVSHFLLQKPTGEFVVAAYSEQLMNGAQTTQTDTIDFGQTFASVTVYNVQSGLTPIATLSNVSSCTLTLNPSDTYLIVLGNPDFTLALSPNQQIATSGDSTSYAVTIGSANGFSSPVNLTVSGLPDGATATFHPATVAGSGSSILNVVTAANTPIGPSTLVVTGSSDALIHTASTTLFVTAPSVPSGVVVSAANAGVTLNWAPVSGATSYSVKRSQTRGGPYTVLRAGLTNTTFTDGGLANGSTYYYVVSATSDTGESANSAEVSAMPQAVTLIIDNTDSAAVALTGTWASSAAVAGYYGTNYFAAAPAAQAGTCTATFRPTITAPGIYDVYARWAIATNRATNAPIDIHFAGGTTTATVNQQANNGTWMLLGSFSFNAGTSGHVVVRNNSGANGYVVADAVRFTLRSAAEATIALSDLSHTYDGSPKAATVTTAPAGLATTVTYNGNPTPPTAPGTYGVIASVNTPSYQGSATGTLLISPAAATITLGDLDRVYDGTAKVVSVVATQPIGLPVRVTYNGAEEPPTNAGSYTVTARVTDPNYVGSTSDTLVIGKAAASVALSSLTQIYDGTPRTVTATTVPAGAAFAVNYNGVASAPIYPGSYAVDAIVTDPNYQGSSQQILEVVTTALVRHAPTLNGILDGSLQMAAAESVTLNGSATVSGDLLLPGTPTVQLNGQPTYAGTLDGSGAVSPSNHRVTLNSNAVLRHVVRRIDPIALPNVDTPPSPTGTRNVAINQPSQSFGDYATLRNLTLNSNVGSFQVPPGTYGSFVANSGSSFVLGITGATEPAIYHLQGLTLNGNSALQVVGPVIVTVAGSVNLNATAGNPSSPEWLMLRIATGGLTLNGAITFYGQVIAPRGAVTVNGNATLLGRVTSDRLVLNSNALLSDPQ